jgi:Kef-type K+ transport system membrane component KefB
MVTSALFHALVALAAILLVARAAGVLFQRIGQPAVVGEIAGGLFLGPSALGAVWPAAYAALLPSSIAPFLGFYAQIGIVLFMFVVGLELDLAAVRADSRRTLAIAVAGIAAPLAVGIAVAWSYPGLAPPGVPFTVFALFIGVSMSVTAFPVLARILAEADMTRTRIGAIALTCAAFGDAFAWCLLALVVSAARAQTSGALVTAVLAALFVVVMVGIVAPRVTRLARSRQHGKESSHVATSLAVVSALAAAAVTERIGIHGLFGAFLLGAIVPHDSSVAEAVGRKLRDPISLLFLPAFFAFTGTRTEILLLDGWRDWLMCATLVAAACAGKIGGILLAARAAGMGWHDSATLGILMNTRGLVELIVLNVGLDLGIISPRLFAMLVVMALVTTMMTMPILRRLRHPAQIANDDQRRAR